VPGAGAGRAGPRGREVVGLTPVPLPGGEGGGLPVEAKGLKMEALGIVWCRGLPSLRNHASAATGGNCWAGAPGSVKLQPSRPAACRAGFPHNEESTAPLSGANGRPRRQPDTRVSRELLQGELPPWAARPLYPAEAVLGRPGGRPLSGVGFGAPTSWQHSTV